MLIKNVVRIGIYLSISNLLAFAQQSTGKPEGEQARTYTAQQVQDAHNRVEKGKVGGFELEVLRHTQDKSALPSLEKTFDAQDDELLKLKTASVLVYLGDADPKYWSYLAMRAQEGVDSSAPDPTGVAADGTPNAANTPSPAFIRWSESQGQTSEYELAQIDIVDSAAVSQLGDTGDLRAVPILRRGLTSNVYLIQVQSAIGLAALHDEDSVQAIVSLCEKDPTEVRKALAAGALVYFESAVAQAAVDRYLPSDYAKVLRESKNNGRAAHR